MDGELVAEALGTALNRPNNQFGILVGTDDAEGYAPVFPNDDAFKEEEGDSRYVVCELRDSRDDRLVVVTGGGSYGGRSRE